MLSKKRKEKLKYFVTFSMVLILCVGAFLVANVENNLAVVFAIFAFALVNEYQIIQLIKVVKDGKERY